MPPPGADPHLPILEPGVRRDGARSSRRPAPRPGRRSASTSRRRLGPCSAAATRGSSPAPARRAPLVRPPGRTPRVEAGSRSGCSSPSRRRPAAASRMTSAWPASSLPRRVSTLPRSGTTSRSGRSAASRPLRRADDVPTRAPGRDLGQRRPRPAAGVAGVVALGHRADRPSPSGISPVRSLALCTAASIRPSRSCRSMSRVKTPRPSPMSS